MKSKVNKRTKVIEISNMENILHISNLKFYMSNALDDYK